MLSFRTVQHAYRSIAKSFAIAGLFVLPLVLVKADITSPRILTVTELNEASLVSVSGGFEQGFRNGMKLIAYNEDGIAAELIVVDVTENETQTLIIELFGQAPLKPGNPVTIKTINFAA